MGRSLPRAHTCDGLGFAVSWLRDAPYPSWNAHPNDREHFRLARGAPMRSRTRPQQNRRCFIHGATHGPALSRVAPKRPPAYFMPQAKVSIVERDRQRRARGNTRPASSSRSADAGAPGAPAPFHRTGTLCWSFSAILQPTASFGKTNPIQLITRFDQARAVLPGLAGTVSSGSRRTASGRATPRRKAPR